MKKVEITSDAYLACLIHAMSTEREEVMGLLLGEHTDDITQICSVCMMRRSDKRSDRVEISPEQLSAAAIEAETLATKLDRNIKVLGWYHSHPHITVWPSHVDIRTQSDYQMMSPDFIGLIFSCFHEEQLKCATQVICFQSIGDDNSLDYFRIPLKVMPTNNSTINPVCADAIVHLVSILSHEEHDSYMFHQKSCNDCLTQIHNGAVYVQSLSHVVQVLGGPLLLLLQEREKRNQAAIQKLTQQKERLEQELSDQMEKLAPLDNNTDSNHSSSLDMIV